MTIVAGKEHNEM